MSEGPVGSPVASGRCKLKHFELKVGSLMKLEKSVSMKRLSEEFGAVTSTTYVLEMEIW
jgi:hypothetical protein